MSQSPKKKARLPKDIASRPDSEAAELIFGKRIKKELDKAVEAIDKKGTRLRGRVDWHSSDRLGGTVRARESGQMAPGSGARCR